MVVSEGLEPLDHRYVVLARAQGVRSMFYALGHVDDIKDAADDVEMVILPEHLIYTGPDFQVQDVIQCEVDILKLRMTVMAVNYNGDFGDWVYEMEVQDNMAWLVVDHDKLMEWKARKV